MLSADREEITKLVDERVEAYLKEVGSCAFYTSLFVLAMAFFILSPWIGAALR